MNFVPPKEWRTACRTTVEIPVSDGWRKIRIPLSGMNDAEKMVRRQLRREFSSATETTVTSTSPAGRSPS